MCVQCSVTCQTPFSGLGLLRQPNPRPGEPDLSTFPSKVGKALWATAAQAVSSCHDASARDAPRIRQHPASPDRRFGERGGVEINVLFPARIGPRPPGWGHGGASAESLFDDIVEWLSLTTPVSQTAEVHPRARTYQHHRNGKRTDRPSATPVRAPFCSGRSPRKRRSPRPRRAQEAGLSP